MGLLEALFANIENTRGQIKRRGLLDLPNIMGEHVAQNIAGPGLLAAEHATSVMPQVREPAQRKMTDTAMGLLGAIKAYHGSPHKFDKFDLSKIGTGEGAQAYGHGLYFAENPGVAKSYQNKLAGANADKALLKMGVPKEHIPNSVSALRQFTTAAENGLPWERAAKNAQNASIGLRGVDTGALVKAMQEYAENRKGGMYETSLRWPDAAREAADPLGPQHFLDWDKPLSKQGETVKRALSGDGPLGMDESVFPHYTGQQLYQGEMNARGPYKSSGWAEALAAEGVSKDLRKLGIPGIRYLDGGSRGAGTGTSNYVMFDDALIEILKRNGVPVKQAAPQGLLTKKVIDASAYQGQHKPNLKDSGAPLHDLTKVYPDDVYGPNGLRYYGTGDPALDAEAYSIAMAAHNRPNKPVKAYRAVPHEKTPDEQLSTLYKQKAAYMSRNIVPKEWGGSKKSLGDMQGFYDWVTAEIAKLEAMPKVKPEKIGINHGDWVTTSRRYAKDHGEGTLGGNYKIVSKSVPARQLFTSGDSWAEFGWDSTAALAALGLLGAGLLSPQNNEGMQ